MCGAITAATAAWSAYRGLAVPTYKRFVRFQAIELHGAEPGWYVRVTLPHGETIDINNFNSENAAIEWIASKGSHWLRKYRAGRYS
jgi:hypothetical protein